MNFTAPEIETTNEQKEREALTRYRYCCSRNDEDTAAARDRVLQVWAEQSDARHLPPLVTFPPGTACPECPVARQLKQAMSRPTRWCGATPHVCCGALLCTQHATPTQLSRRCIECESEICSTCSVDHRCDACLDRYDDNEFSAFTYETGPDP